MIDFGLLSKLREIKNKYNLDINTLDKIKDYQNRPFTLIELKNIIDIEQQKLMKLIIKLKEHDYLTTFVKEKILNIELTNKAKNRINEIMNDKTKLLSLSSEENNLINQLIEIINK